MFDIVEFQNKTQQEKLLMMDEFYNSFDDGYSDELEYKKQCLQNMYYVVDTYLYMMAIMKVSFDTKNFEYNEYYTPFSEWTKFWDSFDRDKYKFTHVSMYPEDEFYVKTIPYDERNKRIFKALGQYFAGFEGSSRAYVGHIQIAYFSTVLQSLEDFIIRHYDSGLELLKGGYITREQYKYILEFEKFVEGPLMDSSEILSQVNYNCTDKDVLDMQVVAKADVIKYVIEVREAIDIENTKANIVFLTKKAEIKRKNDLKKKEQKIRSDKAKNKRKKEKANRKRGRR